MSRKVAGAGGSAPSFMPRSTSSGVLTSQARCLRKMCDTQSLLSERTTIGRVLLEGSPTRT
eukprot:4377068-Prymnesium_polylepis.1